MVHLIQYFVEDFIPKQKINIFTPIHFFSNFYPNKKSHDLIQSFEIPLYNLLLFHGYTGGLII